MNQADELVLLNFVGTTAVVSLNRPQRHNSLVSALLQKMLDVPAEVAADESVRAVVLRANGRPFSTSGDALGFVQHADNMAPYAREIVGLLNQVILALIDLTMPVITAVQGIVTSGSLGFILGSDIVLVAPEASFAPFYSEVGPSPDGGWAVLLPLIIGQRRAVEVLHLNKAIEAETAVAWGLANRIVLTDQIQAEALGLAKAIAAKKQGSIRHTKQLLRLNRAEIAARLNAELDHFVQQMITAKAIDGFREFVERHVFRFTGNVAARPRHQLAEAVAVLPTYCLCGRNGNGRCPNHPAATRQSAGQFTYNLC